MLDPQTCFRALRSRDERFDGRLFVGVTSTGIYCRPVCPARPVKFEHLRFFPSAAAAQEAGFRPCLRCRPETAPDTGSWRGTSNTVSRGLALIAEGALDADGASIDALAEKLGVGERQLRRLFRQHLGASPVAVAQTRRVLLAKHLLHETRLPMAEVALAAGFASVRRFNELFQHLFGRPPSALRRESVRDHVEPTAEAGFTVRLRYRTPFDWNALLAHLASRAVEGVERVDGGRYARTVSLDGDTGTVEIAHVPTKGCIAVTLHVSSVRAVPGVVLRVRRVFDLGADVRTIGEHLSTDPLLAGLVRARPGLRAPGAWDGFELAARIVLHQQVSLAAGKRLAGQLARICGTPLPPAQRRPGLDLAFPTAREVARADLEALGMPAARRATLIALAKAAVADPLLFQPLDTLEETVARLRAVPGVGEWTAQCIALRASREPDAFPAGDVGLLRGATVAAAHARRGKAKRAERMRETELLERAERWRPWRAYAAQHLWAADALAPEATERKRA